MGVVDKANPAHYKSGKVAPIDLIEAYDLDFCTGNVIKYVARADQKDGHDDYRKALWYLLRKVGFSKDRIEAITTEAREFAPEKNV